MPDYYPEFYRQRRQRELAYRRATIAVVGFVLIVLVCAAIGYFFLNMVKPRGTQPGASPQLAQQQAQLQIDQKLADTHPPQQTAQQAEAQPAVDLRGVKYSQSFPAVKVGVQGAQPPQANEVQPGQAGAGQPPAAGRTPQNNGGAVPPANAAPVNPSAAGPVGPAAPSTPNQAVASPPAARVTPTDEAAKKKAAADKKKADDKAKRDAQRKAQEQDKQDESVRAPSPETQSAAKPKQGDSGASGKPAEFVYTVYVGTFLNQAAAEKAKGDLEKTLGLTGSVVAGPGDYMVSVTRVKEQAEAQALSNKLQQNGFPTFVTRKVAR